MSSFEPWLTWVGTRVLMMDLSRLQICFLAGTLGQGGAERQLFLILRALRQSGTHPRLLCISQNEFWEERIRNLGVPVTWVGQAQSRLKRLFRILSELRRDRPAVLQSQHFYTNAYVGFAALLLRLSGIGAIRGNGCMEVQSAGAIDGWLSLHTPRRMTANSRAAIRYAERRGFPGARLHFLPNAVDTEQFKPAARETGNSVRLVLVGSLLKVKRVDRFISVLARLRRETGRDIQGTIVGDGPLRDALQRQAGDLGLLPGSIEFRGSVADVAPVYHRADISVLTSEAEGTPNVLLEAMASGLPVVASRVGGVPEIVQDGKNGFTVSPGNEEALFSALMRLIDDVHLRMEMGRNASAYVRDNHSVDGLPAILTALYRIACS